MVTEWSLDQVQMTVMVLIQVTHVFLSGADRPGASWAVTLTVRLLVINLDTALAWTPMETEWP